MAKRVIVVDDLDGETEADETVVYGLDGEFFEVDLCAANAKRLREFLGEYLSVSRPIGVKEAARRGSAGGAGGAGGGSPAPAADFDPAVVRGWAQANGIEVGEKGRVPEQVVRQWRAATEPGAAKDAPAS